MQKIEINISRLLDCKFNLVILSTSVELLIKERRRRLSLFKWSRSCSNKQYIQKHRTTDITQSSFKSTDDNLVSSC